MEQKGQVRQGQLTSHVMDSPYSGHNIVDSPEKSGKRAKGKKVMRKNTHSHQH